MRVLIKRGRDGWVVVRVRVRVRVRDGQVVVRVEIDSSELEHALRQIGTR